MPTPVDMDEIGAADVTAGQTWFEATTQQTARAYWQITQVSGPTVCLRRRHSATGDLDWDTDLRVVEVGSLLAGWVLIR